MWKASLKAASWTRDRDRVLHEAPIQLICRLLEAMSFFFEDASFDLQQGRETAIGELETFAVAMFLLFGICV